MKAKLTLLVIALVIAACSTKKENFYRLIDGGPYVNWDYLELEGVMLEEGILMEAWFRKCLEDLPECTTHKVTINNPSDGSQVQTGPDLKFKGVAEIALAVRNPVGNTGSFTTFICETNYENTQYVVGTHAIEGTAQCWREIPVAVNP